MSKNKPCYYVIIPAAGTGQRMHSTTPKQYLPLQGKTVLEHTIAKFLYHPQIEKIFVVVNSQDYLWSQLQLENYFEKIVTVIGGSERYISVLNGLNMLSQFAESQDFVLVHDAVRPCLHASDIDKLIQEVGNHPVGGILATKVRDTLKQLDVQTQTITTMERDNIWQALTPQMFRYNLLTQALQNARHHKKIVTDEAAAIEALGLVPMMIEGRKDNIKVTYAEDLLLAERYLHQGL